MFERFTEKAINVVTESQNYAKMYGYSEVTPELLFLTNILCFQQYPEPGIFQYKALPEGIWKNEYGALYWIRTSDRLLRRQLLCPTELTAHGGPRRD